MPRKQTRPPPRWATLKEAAEYAHTSRRALYDWISRGSLPAYRLGPRLIQVDLNDVDRLRVRIPAGWIDEDESNGE